MYTNYGRPIYLTGDLIRSITAQPNLQYKRVAVGSNLNYAETVHEGTSKTAPRRYIKDALLENTDIWREIIKEELSNGFSLSST